MFDSLLVRVALGPAVALALLYVYMRLIAFRYWQRRGIPSPPANFPFGHFGPMLRQQRSVGELVQDVYNRHSTDRIVGIYGLTRPMLIIRDPALVRRIFVRDFAHFTDRGVYSDERRDPLSGNLFSLSGDRWRQLRVRLSPVFTSGKLRASMETLLQCGDTLHAYMREAAADGSVLEVREISARFATDVIASVAFGAEVNCMRNPETAFRRYGRKTFELSVKNGVRAFTFLIAPQLQRWLGLKMVDADVEEFVMALVRKTMEHREKHRVVRKDLFQLLVQLRNGGRVSRDEDAVWEAKAGGQGDVCDDEEGKTMTVEEVAAQAWVFYAAGFETSSSTMLFALYELARNGQCQRRVQEEIDRVMTKYEQKITYESLGEMRYLEACIDETLRKYPIVPILNRECTQDYHVPDSQWHIEKGTAIIIPLLGMQRDPLHYEQPLEFRPERFADGTSANDRPYWPFGEGPRVCIGLRLAKMQMKVGLTRMLQDCCVQLADERRDGNGLRMSSQTFVLAAEGGVKLRVTPRQK